MLGLSPDQMWKVDGCDAGVTVYICCNSLKTIQIQPICIFGSNYIVFSNRMVSIRLTYRSFDAVERHKL